MNGAALALDPETTDALVLVNNDVVCEPDFVEQILAPLGRDGVGMVAGVLVQHERPDLVDSAGIELDTTLRSWDALWNRPLADVGSAPEPVGPCGGAAAYSFAAFREVGGFDDAFFAYWEDVDLALRLRLAGHRCVRAEGARAVHRHGQTLGAASPAQRRLEAFGRAFVLARYRVARTSLLSRLRIAALDWPVLLVHLVIRREAGPIRERMRGTREGLARAAAARAARARDGLVRRGAPPPGADPPPPLHGRPPVPLRGIRAEGALRAARSPRAPPVQFGPGAPRRVGV